MLKRRRLFAGPISSVAMLITASTGAVLFTIIAGALVYNSTHKLIAAAARVEHTQEVLSSLQSAAQFTERIEYSAHLFHLTGDEEQLAVAQSNANQLEAIEVQLKALVAGDASQTGNVDKLRACASELIQILKSPDARAANSRGEILQCQQALSIMGEQERRLLSGESRDSENSSVASFTTDFVFVGLSLLTLLTLFGFLLRHAVFRQRIGRQLRLTNRELAESVKALQDQAQELELLTLSRDELQLCVNLQQVYRSAANSFERLLPQSSGSLCMINSSRNMVEVVSSWGLPSIEDCHLAESCCGLRSGHPRWRQPGISEIHCTHFIGPAPDCYICIPIAAQGDTLGVLYVQCPPAGMAPIQQRMDGLRQLLQLTGMAVASLNLRIRLENQSIRDKLTGLFNRHFMEIVLERELSRAERRKSIIAVFMLDVDHFKQFNDTHGHAAGDAVLKAVAEVFRTSVRVADTACRYGGEEFTIILPDITPEAAWERAESIRHAVAKLLVPLDKGAYGEVTVSIGIALYPSGGKTVETLLRKADQELYRAKRQGRNQVAFAEAALPAAV